MMRLLATAVPCRALVFAAAAGLAAGAIAVTEWTQHHIAPSPAPVIEGIPHEIPAPVKPAKQLHIKVQLGVQFTMSGAQRMFPLVNPDSIIDDRERWYTVDVPADQADNLVATLQHDATIEYAFVAPEITLPTMGTQPGELEHLMNLVLADDSCPITTPSFESYQGYVGPAPHGIDAPAAWRRGVTGGGVWFADVEGGWNAQHEDLPGDRISLVNGREIRDRGWREHGTAVLGEVVGRNNAKGVTGIAPDVERVFTSSIGNSTVAAAIDTAARNLRAGDVLLIELQSSGPRGRWIPVEFWPDVYEVIAAATARGVVIVEAAGNGAEDLDRPIYEGRFDRKKRDSGAIMVGAGGPPRPGFTDRERLDFSNFGGRVDVQGWGRMVATLDYGDLQSCDDTSAQRHYTNEFSGTSSASPIVAGAAILLESAARATPSGKGKVIEPRVLRAMLAETGTPQVGGAKEHIGPRPDLAKALKRVR